MRTRTTLTLAALCLSLVCAGCGTAPWNEGAAASPTPTRAGTASAVAPTPKASASTAPTASTAPVQNDLAKGSAKRKVEAGGVSLSINYWSTLPMGDWTGAALKPLNLSASAKFIDGSERDIFLSKVTVNVAVDGPEGPLKAPAALLDQSTLDPGYVVKSPSSYGQVFTIPALASGATSVTVVLTYELLAETEPDAMTYAKQTASDTLTMPIVS